MDSSFDSSHFDFSSFDFSKWTGSELARAEATAEQFLSEHQLSISQVFARQCVILQRMVALLGVDNLTLEERLDCFARIGEVADGMQRSANGFFNLGSQPLVARMLTNDSAAD
jgi:hypothetical protein